MRIVLLPIRWSRADPRDKVGTPTPGKLPSSSWQQPEESGNGSESEKKLGAKYTEAEVQQVSKNSFKQILCDFGETRPNSCQTWITKVSRLQSTLKLQIQ